MLIDLLQYCLSPSIFAKILVDCTVPDGADAILSCANDTLLVNWPTTQTYPASVTEIPSALKRTLNDNGEQIPYSQSSGSNQVTAVSFGAVS